MKIVVDIQALQNGSRHRGIGRYCQEFFRALMRKGTEHDYTLLLSGLMDDQIDLNLQSFKQEFPAVEIKVWDGLAPACFMDESNSWRRAVSEVLREEFIESLCPDLLIIGSIFEGCGDDTVISVPPREARSYVTMAILYDLIPYIYKNEYLADKRVLAWYEARLKSLASCDYWLAISESSMREAIDILSLPEEKVVNISAAVGPEFRPISFPEKESATFKKKLRISRPFVLYSGATDPRKNVERLIEAFATLDEPVRKSFQLVIAGGMPEDHRERFERLAIIAGLSDGDVVITGRVSDEELVFLYNNCRCFVFPSYHEGFGLPVLEAMSCGAPTVGSDVSSIPEVIEMADAMFNPLSIEAIGGHIKRAILDEKFRENLKENAKKQAAKFSWDNSAALALKFIDSKLCRTEHRRLVACRANAIERISTLCRAQYKKEELVVVSALLARLAPRRDSRKYIFVDVSELSRRDLATGIQRVVKSISRVFSEKISDEFCIRFVRATESDGYRYADAMFASYPAFAHEEGKRIDPREGDFFVGLDFHDQIVAANEHYYDFMRRRGVSVQFVLYDILPISLERYFSAEVRSNFEKWLRIVGRSDRLICISESVAREYAQWRAQYDSSASAEISWFHLGADIKVDTSVASDSPVFGATEATQNNPIFLMVGTVEPRKGYREVLDGFEEYWAHNGSAALVLVGRAGWMMDDFIQRIRSHSHYGRKLFWVDNASDALLLQLYRKATCLIAASEGEGFGLPLIEAAQHKLPIIARDIPVFREVAGQNAFYFENTRNSKTIAVAIERWLELNSRGRAPQSTGISWLTWKQSAERLFEIVMTKSNSSCVV